MRAVSLGCPTCGAPLDFAEDATLALCLYCRNTARLVRAGAGPSGDAVSGDLSTASAEQHEVPTDVSERVIALVMEGKRPDALTLYAQAARCNERDAEAALASLLLLTTARLTRRMPLRPLGWLFSLTLLALLGSGLAACVEQVLGGDVRFAFLAMPLAVLVYLLVAALGRRGRSQWIARFGARAQAKIVRVATIDPKYASGRGILIVLHMVVKPEDGSAPFDHQEPMPVLAQSLEKLKPNNIIQVRYSRTSDTVFPTLPITVVGQA
jgi:hypothetical protein